LLNSNLAT